MPGEIKRYALDPTGVNPNNTVVGEIHTLSAVAVRALIPTYGPIFANDRLQIWDNLTGRLLARGRDFVVAELLKDATLLYGQEIVEMILIINTEVSSQVRLNYNNLGGPYQSHIDAVIRAYEAFNLDTRVVDYANVMNKPLEFNPSFHAHLLKDVYGFQALVASLERIRNAVTLADVPAYEQLIAWVRSRGMTVEEFKAGTAQDKFVTGAVLYYIFKKLGLSWPKDSTVTITSLLTSCCINNPKIPKNARSLYLLGN